MSFATAYGNVDGAGCQQIEELQNELGGFLHVCSHDRSKVTGGLCHAGTDRSEGIGVSGMLQ